MEPTVRITSADRSDMVRHWLGCPSNGYLGQSYGQDMLSVLQTPMAAGVVNDQIEKLRSDVPLAGKMGPGGINVYSYDADIDKKVVVIAVGNDIVPITGSSQ